VEIINPAVFQKAADDTVNGGRKIKTIEKGLFKASRQ
jgi:hypothetical protein